MASIGSYWEKKLLENYHSIQIKKSQEHEEGGSMGRDVFFDRIREAITKTYSQLNAYW